MIERSRLVDLIRRNRVTQNGVDHRCGMSALFELAWCSGSAVHTDCHFEQGLALSPDSVPPQLHSLFANPGAGDTASFHSDPGQLLLPFEATKCIEVDADRFKAPTYRNISLLPAAGRFYPRRFIAGVNGIDRQDIAPMRVTAVGAGLGIDLNHPLASRDLTLAGTLVDAAASDAPKRAGRPGDIVARVTGNGPGMQARWNNRPTDFWSADPFARDDMAPDSEFYRSPRLVSHIDAHASEIIGELYRQWLGEGSRVLDLMASWESHLPDDLSLSHLTGLGMNSDELARNKRLDAYVIHDLNAETGLPFENGVFDAVICTVSVEYLVRPLEVFADVARVLKPGGRFVVTFSNRWFPPKAIRIWQMLHDYERMGLVLEYFQLCGWFADLATWSLRGLPRPGDDKYADRLANSDPVYAVCGTRRSQPLSRE